jgi:hypothetical protein
MRLPEIAMDFLEAVDAAVDEALPPEWPRVAPERLGREREGVAQVRHAFALWRGGADGPESGDAGARECGGPGAIDTGDVGAAGNGGAGRRKNGGPGAVDGGGPGAGDGGGPGAIGGSGLGEMERGGPGAGDGGGQGGNEVREAGANERAGAARRRGPYLGIIALPRQAVGLPEAQAARELTALRDQALARGGQLLLLYEQEGLDSLDELGGFIATRLDLPHPRWLALGCARGASGVWSAEPTPSGREPLAGIVRDLWRGGLRFRGPRVGRQTVGVELMREACWCCEQPIATVTGLVFPDRPVADWSSRDWRYFRRLLPLAEIEPRTLAALAAQVEQWLRAESGGERITPLGVRSSLRPRPAARRSSWAALCPDCGALRGAFLVGADRLDLLLDGESRRTGRLSYRPWEIEVGWELLKALATGTELSVYACALGWRRARGAAGVAQAGPGGSARPAEAGERGEGALRLAGMVGGGPGVAAGTSGNGEMGGRSTRSENGGLGGRSAALERAPEVPAVPTAEALEELVAQAERQLAQVEAGVPAGRAGRRRLWRALAGVRAWAAERRPRQRARG